MTSVVKKLVALDLEVILSLLHHRPNHSAEGGVQKLIWEINDILGYARSN